MKINHYEGKCKACGWIFAQNSTPNIAGMPPSCEKCKGDMGVIPVFEEDSRGRSYELRIFCKETGADISDGAVISNEDFKKLSRQELVRKIVVVLSESFANIMTDEKKLARLLGERG